jgi:hypothetical protein
MEQKNPILNFRKKQLLISKSTEKNSAPRSPEYSTMITETRESIDSSENS